MRHVKKMNISIFDYQIADILKSMYYICLVGSLIEEFIFRILLKEYLVISSYDRIINSFLFGLWHIQNYFIHKDYGLTIIQVITTIHLGYYLYQFNDIKTCFFIHCLYNCIIATCCGLISYLTLKYKIREDTLSRDSFNNLPKHDDDIFEVLNKFEDNICERMIPCPTKCRDDFDLKNMMIIMNRSNSSHKLISMNKLRPDIKEMHQKLNPFMKKRRLRIKSEILENTHHKSD